MSKKKVSVISLGSKLGMKLFFLVLRNCLIDAYPCLHQGERKTPLRTLKKLARSQAYPDRKAMF